MQRMWRCNKCFVGGCSDVEAKDARCLPWMVSVSKDCSISLSMLVYTWTWTSRLLVVSNDFATAIRGKQQMELGACNTKRERHSSHKKGLCKKDVAPPQLFGTLYTFRPLKHWTWFHTMLSTIIDDIAFTGLLMFEKQVLTFPFIKGNVICKKDVLKLVHFVCEYMLLWTVSKLSPKQSVEPVELSCPHLSSFPRSRPSRPTPEATAADGFPEKAPEAKRRSTWRRGRATERLQGSCCPKGPRWTQRGKMARGLGGRKQGQKSRLSNLGHFKKCFGLEILRKMSAFSVDVWERCDFPLLNMRQILGSMITM